MSGLCLRSGARFSPCRTWRYTLTRVWGLGDRRLNVIGLNPSTADEAQDDPTIRRCAGFAKRLGCDGLVMTNLFAFRSTHPADLRAALDPVGPENDDELAAAAIDASVVVAAWGVHGELGGRARAVMARFRDQLPWVEVLCFGVTKGGHPRHLLYLPSTAALESCHVDRDGRVSWVSCGATEWGERCYRCRQSCR